MKKILGGYRGQTQNYSLNGYIELVKSEKNENYILEKRAMSLATVFYCT